MLNENSKKSRRDEKQYSASVYVFMKLKNGYDDFKNLKKNILPALELDELST